MSNCEEGFYASEKCLNREFRFYLNNAYFHQSRDKEYPSEDVKLMARRAMILLWNTESLFILGKHFNKRQIQQLMLYEMMPEDLDRAVSFFCNRVINQSSNTFAAVIFIAVLLSDEITEIGFRYYFPQYADNGGAA